MVYLRIIQVRFIRVILFNPTIIKPLVRQLSFGNENKPLKRLLKKWDRKLNNFLNNRYAQMLPQHKLDLPSIKKADSLLQELTQVSQ